ncbi:helix-turn-helix protein [Kushneria sinocarnis]|uniref:Helix-turn-helix protein n=1 Tax=Kushneria sinocarnis TaxID=595502 RepID=A0A420X1N6_9GAMM|nr:helix-turn-helix domain-containing protein [Kushneria sinocarnis]RKR07657.1 helix-turn-helix protein [Kushneria sinocarnis]
MHPLELIHPADAPFRADYGHERAAGVMQAMGHGLRLHILQLLAAEGELGLTEFEQQLGIDSSQLAGHLQILQQAELVWCRRQPAGHCYMLRGDEVITLLRSLKSLFG